MISQCVQKRAAQVGLLALCLLTSGCGTFIKWSVYSDYRESRADHELIPQDFLDRPSPFVATKIDLLVLSSPFRVLAQKDFFEQDVTHWIYFGIPFALVDLPFALLADTVLLPYDAGVAWRAYRQRKHASRKHDKD